MYSEALPGGGPMSPVWILKRPRVSVYKCLSVSVGFAVTVTIWPREVVSCRDFILSPVATFWAMSLVGIYPGRASIVLWLQMYWKTTFVVIWIKYIFSNFSAHYFVSWLPCKQKLHFCYMSWCAKSSLCLQCSIVHARNLACDLQAKLIVRSCHQMAWIKNCDNSDLPRKTQAML